MTAWKKNVQPLYTADEVEQHNREAHIAPPPSPVPHVFYTGWGSGRLGGPIQFVTLASGEEVLHYQFWRDDDESRKRDRALLEF